jgi:RNA polymerase sigma factor (sigma-70 family)
MGSPARLIERPKGKRGEDRLGAPRPSSQGMSASFRAASDRRLARRASRGDRRAMGAIFERYRQELYGFCLGLLGEPQDAQDALQNTMVKVLRALPGEEREIALRPWLYRIAHNEAIELRRSRHPTQALEAHLAEQMSVSERAEQRERLEWVLKDIADLPDRQRAVLVMRELSGLDFAEIGAALDTTGAVVRQSLYEARRNLEQMDRGRSLKCEAIARVLSDADGRITRRRDIRAHLRDCSDCRRFRDAIGKREGALSTLPLLPFPTAAAAGVTQAIFGASGGGGGVAALTGVAKSAGAYGVLKAAGTVAAVTVIGTAAIQGGMKAAAPDSPSPDARQPGAREDTARSPSPQGAEVARAMSAASRPTLIADGSPSAPASAQVSDRRPLSSAPEHGIAAVVAAHPSDLRRQLTPASDPPAVAAEAGFPPAEEESGHPGEPAKHVSGTGKEKSSPAAKPEKSVTPEHPPHPPHSKKQKASSKAEPASSGAAAPPSPEAQTEAAKTPPGQAKKGAKAEQQPAPEASPAPPEASSPPVEIEPAGNEAEAPPPGQGPEPNGKAKGHEK